MDLRAFLTELETHGLLLTLEKPVDPVTEVSSLMEELDHRAVAGLFTHVLPEGARVVYNTLGSRLALALALGCSPAQTTRVVRDRSQRRLSPKVVTDPPSQTHVYTDDADLRRLPLIVHSERDAGPYITAGMVITADPDTGRRNVSFNRMMLAGPREAGIRMMAPQQLGQIHAKAESMGQDLPVAIAVGMHPLDHLAGATSIPMGDDELELAGALREEPLKVTEAVSVPLQVPARAEYILEGYVRSGVREPEGPFGDFLDFYIPVMDNHRFVLTAITHRPEPIWQTMYAGSPEDVLLLGVSREAEILDAVEALGTRVHSVGVGPTIFTATIAISPRYEGEARAVGLAALARYRWLKYCIVTNDDVDTHDFSDVWWAVSMRGSPDKVSVIPDSGGFPRDPHRLHRSKMIIDATVESVEHPEFERRRRPGGPLNLDDYL
jgi:2,5-furandicarboxylate decarboxylase 1